MYFEWTPKCPMYLVDEKTGYQGSKLVIKVFGRGYTSSFLSFATPRNLNFADMADILRKGSVLILLGIDSRARFG